MSYDDFVDDPEWEAKYRWCVYCKADCWVDDPEHTTECPTSTGVFPIREGDKDMLCCRCKAPLSDSCAKSRTTINMNLPAAKTWPSLCAWYRPR
jgi:hypothetical protein